MCHPRNHQETSRWLSHIKATSNIKVLCPITYFTLSLTCRSNSCQFSKSVGAQRAKKKKNMEGLDRWWMWDVQDSSLVAIMSNNLSFFFLTYILLLLLSRHKTSTSIFFSSTCLVSEYAVTLWIQGECSCINIAFTMCSSYVTCLHI